MPVAGNLDSLTITGMFVIYAVMQQLWLFKRLLMRGVLSQDIGTNGLKKQHQNNLNSPLTWPYPPKFMAVDVKQVYFELSRAHAAPCSDVFVEGWAQLKLKYYP